MLIRRLPEGLFAQGAARLGSGLGLTLMVPSSTARTRLLLPTVVAAAQSQRFKDGSPQSAFPGLAAFVGAKPLALHLPERLEFELPRPRPDPRGEPRPASISLSG